MGIYNLGGGGGAPELQAKEATPLITNAQQIILPDDGYDGLSKVTVNPMPTGILKTPTVNSIGYVSSGVQTAAYFDTSATSGLQLSTQEAKTITPTTYSQTAVASGKYTTGNVTVAGDANLVSSNIVAGKSIFGVSGSRSTSAPVFAKGSAVANSSSAITIQFSTVSGTENLTGSNKYLLGYRFRRSGGWLDAASNTYLSANYLSDGTVINDYWSLINANSTVLRDSISYVQDLITTNKRISVLWTYQGNGTPYQITLTPKDGGTFEIGKTYEIVTWFTSV